MNGPWTMQNEAVCRMEALGKYGGCIAAPPHGFQPDTPIENVLAMHKAVTGKKYGRLSV